MKSATLLASLFSFAWAAVALAADRPPGSQTVSVAGSQPAAKGPAEYFTGNVRVDPLFAAKDTTPFSGAYVTFEPGARSAWHTHPAGQHLIITSGVGWTQEWGGPVTEIRTGDVVWCPPGVKHWHGATPTTAMTHVALTGTAGGKNVDWLEKVLRPFFGGDTSLGFSSILRRSAGGSPSAAFSMLPPSSRAISTSSRFETTERGASSAMSRLLGPLVAVLDEQPGGLASRRPPARPHQHPRALQLLAVEPELQLALLQRRVHVLGLGSPRAAVPDHHGAAAVLALRNDALELVVLDRVVLDLHRQALDGRVERGPLRDRPRQHHAVPLEPEVVVERGRAVLLDHEGELLDAAARRLSLGLRRHAEAALLPILLECHGGSVYCNYIIQCRCYGPLKAETGVRIPLGPPVLGHLSIILQGVLVRPNRRTLQPARVLRADASSLLGVIVDPGLLGLQRGDEELFDCLHHLSVCRHIVGDRRSACDARGRWRK